MKLHCKNFTITVTYDMEGLQFWGKLPMSDFYKWENKLYELIEIERTKIDDE